MKHFIFALKGIWIALKEQRNLRLHVLAAVAVVVAASYFRLEAWEWCVLVVAIGLVITAELINSAIESLVNLVSPDQHPLAGKVKDIAAGAVLISAICAAFLGGIVFWGHIF